MMSTPAFGRIFLVLGSYGSLFFQPIIRGSPLIRDTYDWWSNSPVMLTTYLPFFPNYFTPRIFPSNTCSPMGRYFSYICSPFDGLSAHFHWQLLPLVRLKQPQCFRTVLLLYWFLYNSVKWIPSFCIKVSPSGRLPVTRCSSPWAAMTHFEDAI